MLVFHNGTSILLVVVKGNAFPPNVDFNTNIQAILNGIFYLSKNVKISIFIHNNYYIEKKKTKLDKNYTINYTTGWNCSSH